MKKSASKLTLVASAFAIACLFIGGVATAALSPGDSGASIVSLTAGDAPQTPGEQAAGKKKGKKKGKGKGKKNGKKKDE
jgi:hypothetical protein